MKTRILLIVSVIMWGLGWIGAKFIAQTDVTGNAIVFYRFLFITLTMLPVIIYRKELKITKRNFLVTLITSIIFLLNIKSIFLGMKHGYPGLASIIFTTVTPIATYFLSTFFDNHKLRGTDIIALVLGAFGALIILKIWNISLSNLLDSSNLYFMLSAIIWAVITIIAQKNLKDMSPYQFTFYYSLLATIIILIFIPNLSGAYLYSHDFWLGMLLHSIIASAIGTTIYFYSASIVGSIKASSYMYILPFVTTVLSYFIFDETFSIYTLLGIILIVISLILINKKDKNIQNKL